MFSRFFKSLMDPKHITMKKILYIFLLLPATQTFAQIPEDAIRYSFYPQNGTARNMATGGVMGSLGGDITANYVNPAGLGFYKTREVVLTPGFTLNSQNANYWNDKSNEKKNSSVNLLQKNLQKVVGL